MTFGDDWETRLQHAVSNIRHAKIQLTPFPYFLVEPFLPWDLYHQMTAYWPKDNSFWGQSELSNKNIAHLEANLRRVVIMRDASGFAKTNSEKEFWGNFELLAHSELLLNEIIIKCKKLIVNSRQDLDIDNVSYRMQSILGMDEKGYFLGPHVDASDTIVNLLLFIPYSHSPDNLGTSIYEPRLKLLKNVPRLTESFSGKYYQEKDFKEVSRAPYRPNVLFGMVNSPSAFHGVKRLTDSSIKRRHIQWVISTTNKDIFPSALDKLERGITKNTNLRKIRLEALLKSKNINT
jgi:hypothetical protein|tara:strand:+ start:199 stop:1071 length:873 start_codon:yes stop_codon:yes gene_type:complete